MARKLVKITDDQRQELMRIWFVFGNNGKKHTHHNHRYIQCLIENNEDTEHFYRNADFTNSDRAKIPRETIVLTDECVTAVKNILTKG
jgi:anti-sigma factor ChrR (cupin superfamily)